MGNRIQQVRQFIHDEGGYRAVAGNLAHNLTFPLTSLVAPAQRRELDGLNTGLAEHPWYAPGLVLVHRTPGIFNDLTACGLSVLQASNARPPIGVDCPRCLLEVRRAERLAGDRH